MLLEGKLTPARFALWHIVIDDNVIVLDEKLHYESLHIRFSSLCNDLKMKANSS